MRDTDDYDYGLRGGLLGNLNLWHMMVALLVAVLGLSLYAIVQFRGVQSPAAMEQATIARQLAEGDGFTTQVIRPFDLWLLDMPLDEVPESVPALWQAPFYPRVLAQVLRLTRCSQAFSANGIMQAESRVMIPLGIACIILITLFSWLLARNLLEDRVAHLAAAVLLLSPVTLQIMLSGGSLALGMLLSVVSFYLCWKAIDHSFREHAVWLVFLFSAVAALSAGLLFLTHYAAVLLVIGMLFWLILNLQRMRWPAAVMFGAIALGVILLGLRGQTDGGWWGIAAYPYGALLDTTIFPGDMLLRDGDSPLRSWQILQAVRDGIASRYLAFFTGRSMVSGGVILVFFVVGLFGREERYWNQQAKWIAALILLLLPALPPVVGCSYGHWPIMFPLVVIFGTQAFYRILDQEEFFDIGARPILVSFLIVLCVMPSALALVRRNAHSPYPPYYGPLQEYVTQWVPADHTLLTDIPWATAWYGRQPSLLWPRSVDQIVQYGDTVGGIYLAERRDRIAMAEDAWQYMRMDGVVPETLPFRTGLFLPAGQREQVLLLREIDDAASDE